MMRDDVTAAARERRRPTESGLTFVELLLVFAFAAVLMMITLNAFSGWNGREALRSGVYTLQNFVHIAQSEASARSRACRFLIDTSTGQFQVVDLNDPASFTDDIVLASSTLAPWLTFEDPTGGSAVTLEFQSGTTYRTTFSSDGSVSAGTGQVFIRGGNIFYRITVYGAGGTRVDRWDGSTWNAGS